MAQHGEQSYGEPIVRIEIHLMRGESNEPLSRALGARSRARASSSHALRLRRMRVFRLVARSSLSHRPRSAESRML